jgi:MFS family permease
VPSAAADLGNLGKQQGEAVSFDWKWYYSVSGLAIWLALILAFVIPKANRNIRILLILVPFVIVNLLWWLFIKFANMNFTDEQEFGIIFNSMAVSVTVLWLIANSFARFGGAIRFLLSFGIVVTIAGLGTLSYTTELSNETAMFLALFIFMALTMLIAITLSRRLCGGKYRPVCFILWLAFWMLLVSLIATFGFIIVGSIIMSSRPDLSVALLMFILAGLIFGLCLYVLNLPFMIMGFAHPFFRERLCACMGFKPMPVTPQKDDIGRISGQNACT